MAGATGSTGASGEREPIEKAVFIRLHEHFDNLYQQMKMQVDGMARIQMEMQDLRGQTERLGEQIEDLRLQLHALADNTESQTHTDPH